MKRAAFTLIELLVTMAIIALMSGLLVTNVSRSLSSNRIADEVALLGSRTEQVRLLAGSTQQSSTTPGLQTDPDSAYYAIHIPPGPGSVTTYAVVKLSQNVQSGTCTPSNVYSAGTYAASCLIQQYTIGNGVTLTNPLTTSEFIAFKAPIKELVNFTFSGGIWQESSPVFNSPFAQLTFNGRTATVNVDSYSGKITATYN